MQFLKKKTKIKSETNWLLAATQHLNLRSCEDERKKEGEDEGEKEPGVSETLTVLLHVSIH